MTSRTTRKFTLCGDDLSESSMSTRTRPFREIDPIEYASMWTPQPPRHGEPNLDLSLGISSTEQSQPPPPLQFPQPPPQLQPQPAPRRIRRNPTHAPGPGKSLTIPPPFPWATNRRAQVHNLMYLTQKGITTISGEVQCKRCDQRYQIEYNLREKFFELAHYIATNKHDFHHRAPLVWLNPTLLRCNLCHQENSVKPVIAEKKKSINWLFLLLGLMMGCCTLEQMKYFCKYTGNHRTGAKDRILYLTYLEVCRQVDPSGPFRI